jgi:2-keto-4-pentenoate hydratase/2-oxohepta-3-ene-1,7-dioic acid hydratase in catechol pathway
MRTKRASELNPGDIIFTGTAGIPREVHAVDITGEWAIIHVLMDGPNTPTAWAGGRTRPLRKTRSALVEMAD